MSVPFSSLRCSPPDRPPCTPLCAGQAEGWGPREGPCPGPVIWNLVRGSEALPGVKVGGILLLSVWPIIGLELWGLRRSDRALGDFSRQGTPFHCPKRRPSPHCPPREGERPTLRGVRLPVPHLRVVFRPDHRQKQSFPRRAFGATHGAGQSLTEGLGVRDSGPRLAIPCPVFLGLFPEASGRGPLQRLYRGLLASSSEQKGSQAPAPPTSDTASGTFPRAPSPRAFPGLQGTGGKWKTGVLGLSWVLHS